MCGFQVMGIFVSTALSQSITIPLCKLALDLGHMLSVRRSIHRLKCYSLVSFDILNQSLCIHPVLLAPSQNRVTRLLTSRYIV